MSEQIKIAFMKTNFRWMYYAKLESLYTKGKKYKFDLLRMDSLLFIELLVFAITFCPQVIRISLSLMVAYKIE